MDRSYLLLSLADTPECSLGRLYGQCPGLMDIPRGIRVCVIRVPSVAQSAALI
jgi:hypothetical protein